jgi:hypothetical protein
MRSRNALLSAESARLRWMLTPLAASAAAPAAPARSIVRLDGLQLRG